MKDRIRNIFRNIDKEVDAIIIKNAIYPFIDENFFYATGLERGIYEGCASILYPDGEVFLIISELEAESARKLNFRTFKNKKDYKAILKEVLSPFKRIGVNHKGILHFDFCELKKMFPRKEFVDISRELMFTRQVKEKREIELIKKACQIADRVMGRIPDIVHEGIHEYEVAAEIDYLIGKEGGNGAFETISSFGKNTAEPHYSHGEARLKRGSLMVFDFGACFKKYNSDITRTFVFGKASGRQRDMHETVLEAQRKAFSVLRPGIKAREVHEIVSSYINSTKFKNRFIHSTGHSLGLAVHDGARLFSDNEMELKENMIFTVEPGIYIPGFGGVRIEDDILIKKEGVEFLTNYSKELEIK
jgi:Xaa-Pro dipeptidase